MKLGHPIPIRPPNISPTGHYLWLPTTTTKVVVRQGEVDIWDEIEMSLQPIKKPAGFGK